MIRSSARFEREAAIAAQIGHPHVIPVHAVGEADGTLFIAMRFVDGVDLRKILTQEGRLQPLRAAAIVDQAGQALDAAHARAWCIETSSPPTSWCPRVADGSTCTCRISGWGATSSAATG